MTMIQLKAKLQHPFALIAQGFVAGVILFWATASAESNAQEPPQATVAAETANR